MYSDDDDGHGKVEDLAAPIGGPNHPRRSLVARLVSKEHVPLVRPAHGAGGRPGPATTGRASTATRLRRRPPDAGFALGLGDHRLEATPRRPRVAERKQLAQPL